MCLAHLLRDATYAIEAGDTWFAPDFRVLLFRAVAIGRRREALKDSTLTQYHADLEGRLDRLLAAAMPDQPAARRLFRAMRRDRDDLFRLITRRDVPRTNSACEPALRPSVIFRKVTGGFGAEWGAVVYATAATVIATGRLHRITALAGNTRSPRRSGGHSNRVTPRQGKKSPESGCIKAVDTLGAAKRSECPVGKA